jgi:Acetyltransferase (GNAT) domain
MGNLEGTSESLKSRTGSVWRLYDFTEVGPAFAAQVRESLTLAHYSQDIEWLALHATKPNERALALVDVQNGKFESILCAHEYDSAIKFGMGGLTVFRWRIRQFDIFEGVVTRRPDVVQVISDGLSTLARLLPRNGAIFLEAIPLDSQLVSVFQGGRHRGHKTFFVLPWGKTNWSCSIRWSGDVDDYLDSIGKESRRNLKRYSKKLLSDVSLRCEVKRFRTPEEAELFLKDGIRVSDKTYQKKQLDLGLSTCGRAAVQIRFAATRDAFVGHILYIDEVPVAFQYGFSYGRVFHVDQIGYDPAWAAHQVGSVLFFEVLRDFEKLRLDGIDTLDFGQGLTVFKERTTNERRQVCNYYLFPRTIRGFLLYHSAKWMIIITDFISRILKYVKLQDSVRALVRRRTGHGHIR